MKFEPIEPPREFGVGHRGGRLRHVGDAWLGDDEVLTLRTPSGTEVDVSRKAWGYYATPSLNGRLRDFGLRAVLTIGVPRDGEASTRMYLMLVEDGEEAAFEEYLAAEEMRVVAWLDSDDAVAEAARLLESGGRRGKQSE
ncbi:MAG: hypothetical protein QOJ97_2765 [Solirubrobacteraceae bacterium]|jgi:hypothetical protein|nr:hypothetical protein [Solirubrobacteraceae bacterium]